MGNCSSKDDITSSPTKTVNSAARKNHQNQKQKPAVSTSTNKKQSKHMNGSSKPSKNASQKNNHGNNNTATHAQQQHQDHANQSSTTNTSSYPSTHHESNWNTLFHNHALKIVDPADLHAVLDEAISKEIQNLHSAEMTLLTRRVRKVVRSLLSTDINSSMNVSSSAVTGINNSSHSATTGNIGFNGAASSHGRMLRAVSSSTTLSNGGGKLRRKKSNDGANGSHVSTITNTSTSISTILNTSKTIYQKDSLLDEYLMKQIFKGGHSLLLIGCDQQWIQQSLEMFQQRVQSRKNRGGSSADDINDQIEVLLKPPHTNSVQQKYQKSGPKRNIRVRDHNGVATTASRNGKKQNTQQAENNTPPSLCFVTDVFANAFYILLHLSETRWDHIANIARISAENANLILDVNEQVNMGDTDEKNKPNFNIGSNMLHHTSSTNKFPFPPPEYPSSNDTNGSSSNDPVSAPVLPNGITLQDVSYLVATALRSTREKRLTLLFYLFLNPGTLMELFESHPTGGVPSWFLEMDNDWILSYASLGHYYYYGGNPSTSTCSSSPSSSGQSMGLNGLFSSSKSSSSSSAKRSGDRVKDKSMGVKDLKIQILSVIETIGVLLHYVPQKSSLDDFGEGLRDQNTSKSSANSNGKKSNTPNSPKKPQRERALSYGDKKYHAAKMHVMLADHLKQLQRNAAEAPIFENEVEQFWRLELIDNFWDTSLPHYSKCKSYYANEESTSNLKQLDLSWTLDEFMTWANSALPDDSSLNLVMHQMFGLGLLPTPAMERNLVSESWIDWQSKDARLYDFTNHDSNDTFSIMTLGINNLLSLSSSKDAEISHFSNCSDDALGVGASPVNDSTVWGGIGGFDGKGGLGTGIMYCIDRDWWDEWASYVKWEWSNGPVEYAIQNRPHGLPTKKLIDNSDAIIRGSLGSFEAMKPDLKKDVDYVLVPPRVWDILYELYGGGPPLPRMILRSSIDSKSMAGNVSIDVAPREYVIEKPMRVPKSLHVALHPLILECRVCDPHQPYRRSEIGPMSIRLMVTVDQPLWSMFAEIILRLPIVHPRGKTSTGKGRARLWKRINQKGKHGGDMRYGPWKLLQNDSADFPVGENVKLDSESYNTFQQSWESYAKDATIESIGLQDGDRLMFEYALVGKDNNFTWPREAAATAGIRQKESEEEASFRQKLRGLNTEGRLMRNTKSLTGSVIDAMDHSGRWYQAEITDIDTTSKKVSAMIESDDDTCGSETEAFKRDHTPLPGEVRAIKVDFSDVGGEEEWINVKSDRLAIHKRFTLDSMKSVDQLDGGKSNGDGNGTKASQLIVLRKHNTKQPSTFQLNTSICSYPGFGACGLYNLGNTCYANSALQCIAYIPLLRSYILSKRFKMNGDINRDNPLGTGGKVLEAYAELLRGMWNGKNGAMQPTRFRSILVRAKQRYIGTEQQDSQELLNDMLDVLHEDSNKVRNKPYVEALEDAWVDKTSLHRVGEETWRRYLRRNRSIIVNTCMGQVLNRVTCPKCNYTSRIFEPFNMLSVPFPSITDVLFKCILIRRATALNCANTLAVHRGKKKIFSPPSKQSIAEEYIIPMSRVADITELRIHLAKVCAIEIERLKLFTVGQCEINSLSSTENIALTYIQDDKNGPCYQFSNTEKSNDLTNQTTPIIAFEATLNTRPEQVNSIEQELCPPKTSNSSKLVQELRDSRLLYGNESECRYYDTNPFSIAKAMSQILWPRSNSDLRPGLRVDAIDRKETWFPGTIVEVQETKVKVHFDNFSSKWDLEYSFDDIRAEKIRPLYSCSSREVNSIDIQMFHSLKDESMNLFGLPFFVECYVEWSNARSGAHILAQVSRYLEGDPQFIHTDHEGNIEMVKGIKKNAEMQRRINEAQDTIAKTIDILIDADKRFVNLVLHGTSDCTYEDLRQKIDLLSSKLERKMDLLLPLIPFELMIFDASYQTLQTESEAWISPFCFTVDMTIGNSLNCRQEILILWKELKSVSNLEKVSFFSPPAFIKHQQSALILTKRNKLFEERSNSPNGMHLNSCLDEFCNEQQLDESECWRCPKCKELREGKQRMNLWRLPDILTFHLKRFNCSARWREKITSKVTFPLTGLDMRDWCDDQSPIKQGSDDDCVYDLIGVVNHVGNMTSGHYTAVAKATACSPEGSEEVEHYFNGAGVHAFGGSDEKEVQSTLWKLIRSKDKDANSKQSRAAQASAKSAAESNEPLWLQFDDDSVEPIPPGEIVSEFAYVLFYRRRRINPSNIAKYSTIE